MSWEVVPVFEMPSVLAAIKSGGCVVCYQQITTDCGHDHALYCHAHDDWDDE